MLVRIVDLGMTHQIASHLAAEILSLCSQPGKMCVEQAMEMDTCEEPTKEVDQI